ncbi:type II toxin-antitoxin system RelE/ParE family toxin [Enterobacter sp.]|uniref:type II toxin-antitoxin system RelE family toxin n=1 Tax=Enterobacter sp. TaxID=42895 RepID=UPI00296EF183|nr:type II toxin-antitoxin system RelE/ParE family toxin [Enterobacter sp.]
MKIIWSRAAGRCFAKLDVGYQRKIMQRIHDIGDRYAPRPDVKKLTTPEDHYRLRVGDYRVIFTVEEEPLNICYIVAVKRRTSTTYLHEERAHYECSVHKG